MTDPLGDMFTRIRNATLAHMADVLVPFSRLKKNLAEILVREGYLAAAEECTGTTGAQELKLTLKYQNTEPRIRSIRRISSPGRRVYVDTSNLPIVYDHLGIAVLSTSKGLMTNKEARKQHIGGEVVCEIF